MPVFVEKGTRVRVANAHGLPRLVDDKWLDRVGTLEEDATIGRDAGWDVYDVSLPVSKNQSALVSARGFNLVPLNPEEQNSKGTFAPAGTKVRIVNIEGKYTRSDLIPEDVGLVGILEDPAEIGPHARLWETYTIYMEHNASRWAHGWNLEIVDDSSQWHEASFDVLRSIPELEPSDDAAIGYAAWLFTTVDDIEDSHQQFKAVLAAFKALHLIPTSGDYNKALRYWDKTRTFPSAETNLVFALRDQKIVILK